MNQAKLTQMVSKLPITVAKKHRKFAGNGIYGIYGRLKKMQKTVTALIRHERIELNYPRADEARGYAERLISDAIRYGDCHKPTMDQAKFWLDDPVLVPKLFQVLAPRYQNWSAGVPYTRLLRAPSNALEIDKYIPYQRAVFELRGNPYPPLPGPMTKKHPGQLHNVLLEEARKDYMKAQSALAQQAETEIQALPDDDTKHLDPDLSALDENENKEMLLSPNSQESATPPTEQKH